MRGPVLIIVAASLWGAWSLCTRTVERWSQVPPPPAFETLVIFAVTLLCTAPLMWRDRQAPKLTPTSLRWLAVLGASDALNALFFFWALQKTTVAIAVVTHYLAPLFVGLLSPLVERTRPSARALFALVLAFVGMVLLLQPWTAPAGAMTGAIYGALSAVFFAANFFIGKHLSSKASAYQLAVWPKVTGLVVLALFVPWSTLTFEWAPLLLLAACSVVLGAVALVLFYQGLKSTPASHASILALFEPMVAVLIGTLLFNEALGVVGAAGAVLVLVGAALILQAGRVRARG